MRILFVVFLCWSAGCLTVDAKRNDKHDRIVKSLKEEIESLKQQLQKQQSDAKEEKIGLQANVVSLQQELELSQAQVHMLAEQHNHDIAEHEKVVAAFESRIETQHVQMHKMRDEMAETFRKKQRQNEEDIRYLQAENQELRREKEALEEKVGTLQQEKMELQQDLVDTQTESDLLRQQLRGWEDSKLNTVYSTSLNAYRVSKQTVIALYGTGVNGSRRSCKALHAFYEYTVMETAVPAFRSLCLYTYTNWNQHVVHGFIPAATSLWTDWVIPKVESVQSSVSNQTVLLVNQVSKTSSPILTDTRNRFVNVWASFIQSGRNIAHQVSAWIEMARKDMVSPVIDPVLGIWRTNVSTRPIVVDMHNLYHSRIFPYLTHDNVIAMRLWNVQEWFVAKVRTCCQVVSTHLEVHGAPGPLQKMANYTRDNTQDFVLYVEALLITVLIVYTAKYASNMSSTGNSASGDADSPPVTTSVSSSSSGSTPASPVTTGLATTPSSNIVAATPHLASPVRMSTRQSSGSHDNKSAMAVTGMLEQ